MRGQLVSEIESGQFGHLGGAGEDVMWSCQLGVCGSCGP